MVDLLGMFRRRPAKRSTPAAGFARSREDITALGDTMGDMLSSPVRDAPPIARDAALPGLDLPRAPDVEAAARARQISQIKKTGKAEKGQRRWRPAIAAAAGLSGCA